MIRRALLSVLGLLVLTSPSALAQPRDSAAADRLFKEGRAAFDKGDYSVACPKFAESQRADPAPGTLLNLALCEEKLGKLTGAKQHIAELQPQLKPSDDRVPLVKALLDKIDARIAHLHVTLAPGAPDATVAKLKRSGEETALVFGTEITVDPGDYELDITAPGRPERHLLLKLAEGQHQDLPIAPEAAAVEQTGPVVTPPPPAQSSAKLRRTIGIVAGGVGVASFGVAAVTGGIIAGKKSALDKECPVPSSCSAKGQGIAADAKKLLPLNTATWIIGIAGVGAGAVLILTALKDDSADPKGATEPKVTAFPAVYPGGGGVGMIGRF